MIDLHTHSLFSDGALIPSELVYRAKVKGYQAIAITDHGDYSTFDLVVPRIKKIAKDLSEHYEITVLPGIEITYVPPKLISNAVKLCRTLGAEVVVIHGETPVETVPKGTNSAGIMSGADILAHPGYITAREVELAKKHGVSLEITTRAGHNKTNEYVAELCKKAGTSMVLNTDAHEPDDLMTQEKIRHTLKASGLTSKDYAQMLKNAQSIIQRRHKLKGR